MAKKRGRPKNIPTPEMFQDLFEQYKKEHKGKVRYTHQVSAKHGLVKIPHEPPLTWGSFDVWLRHNGYIEDTEDYRGNLDGRYSSFKGVIRTINQEIYEDKFIGASVGEYQHNIIARDLGLIDKQEVKRQKIRVTRKKSD
jgi:hypothetical protein